MKISTSALNKVILGFFLVGFFNSSAQEVPVDTSFVNSYYLNKKAMQEFVPVRFPTVVFVGNSITEQGLWREWFPEIPVLNRGIGGDNCWGLDARIGKILDSKPAAIFMLIGINDLGRGLSPDLIGGKYEQIIRRIMNESPGAMLLLHTVLPVNEKTIRFDYMKGKTQKILELNTVIRRLADKYDLNLLDLHEIFADEQNQMPEELTVDGLHLNFAGYRVWIRALKESGVFREFENNDKEIFG